MAKFQSDFSMAEEITTVSEFSLEEDIIKTIFKKSDILKGSYLKWTLFFVSIFNRELKEL